MTYIRRIFYPILAFITGSVFGIAVTVLLIFTDSKNKCYDNMTINKFFREYF